MLCSMPFRRSFIRHVWSSERRCRWASPPHYRAHCYINGEDHEHCNWYAIHLAPINALTNIIFFSVGQVISGLGAGLNELTALAGTSEMVPKRKRGAYVGAVVFTIVPFCPSVLWAQLITQSSTWRYVGLLVGLWNFVGLVLVLGFYKDPARNVPIRPKSEVLREIDYVGGFLSTAGVTCFMLGLQFGAAQVWNHHTLLLHRIPLTKS